MVGGSSFGFPFSVYSTTTGCPGYESMCTKYSILGLVGNLVIFYGISTLIYYLVQRRKK